MKDPHFGTIETSLGIDTSYIPETVLNTFLKRHMKGDWGDADKEQRNFNQITLRKCQGGRLLSKYTYQDKEITIVTNGWGWGQDPNKKTLCRTFIRLPHEVS